MKEADIEKIILDRLKIYSPGNYNYYKQSDSSIINIAECEDMLHQAYAKGVDDMKDECMKHDTLITEHDIRHHAVLTDIIASIANELKK